jgi:cell division protein FtsI/penicillin-binding protein 2
VIRGIETFTAWVRGRSDAPGPARATRWSIRRASGSTALALSVALAVGACGGSSASPQATLTSYLGARSRGDWAAMRDQVLAPPADFIAVNSETFRGLGISRASFTAGRITTARSGGSARARVSERFTLPHVGVWSPVTAVNMVKRDGKWYIRWSPTTVNPSLRIGEKLAVRRVWPARAPILGSDGAPLTGSVQRVIVGVVGARIKRASDVRADLLAAGASRPNVSQALAQAAAHPAGFEPVFTVSVPRFGQLKGQPGPQNVYSVPGTEFERTSASAAITPQLTAHLVGSLGPITAEELGKFGAPYDASSIVGQTGLQASQERRLAGVPSTHIDIEEADGSPVRRLASFGGRPGAAVRTSIDPRVQRAAEQALAQSTRPNVSMVAIRASTGQVLAAVSDPLGTYDTALAGVYPPGSTFKVLNFTALYGHGLTPSSPISCPPTVTVDGEPFHNAQGVGPALTIDAAFTESCNTAFINLATAHLSPADFPAAGRLYGLNGTPQLGLPAFSANVPAPKRQTELAADAIGQGRVTFSPLGMAQVAAAIDSGAVRAPTLVQGAAGDTRPPSTLPAGLVSDLRAMMAQVTTSGTAAGTGLPAGTHAKTGTAQYGLGPESQLKIDGWLMGYYGDIAFAIVTHDTGGPDGGPVDGPLIARFLDALH